MLAYIFRRLLLIIPTLFGILLINFVIIQAVRKSQWQAPATGARKAWTRR